LALGWSDEAAERAERALESARAQRLGYEEALLLLITGEARGSEADAERAARLLADLGAIEPYVYRFPSPML
jgi:hypothetical protein